MNHFAKIAGGDYNIYIEEKKEVLLGRHNYFIGNSKILL